MCEHTWYYNPNACFKQCLKCGIKKHACLEIDNNESLRGDDYDTIENES